MSNYLGVRRFVLIPRISARIQSSITAKSRIQRRCLATESSTAKLQASLLDPTLFRQNAYTFEVNKPATGEIIGTCPEMNKAETSAAISQAQKSFESFQYRTARQRMTILKRWHKLMRQHKDDLARILMFENGRPISAAGADIDYVASFFEWFQGEAVRVYGDTIEASTVGVIGILTPWNFPCAMITRKVGAAVVAGCTIVLKPAAEIPYSTLALAEVEMCDNDDVKKISFTGSTGVGKLLMAQSASSLKKLSLELGGNAPFIVFDDASLENAVAGLMAAKFRASDQTCVCANSVYVQEGIYDRFVSAFAEEVQRSMQPGGPEDLQTTLGCLINDKAVQKVERLVEDAIDLGAEIVLGGKKQHAERGHFYPATILKYDGRHGC
ncbi:ALDH-like protein [Hyaloscypha variabilis F]|uniref:ALDH-like protein n=1 Tax=Hyaloscypha variabilis (strain UAMH 11265 / GT02V1 / F) TaxID=1149755 RepID=A0A2J6RLT5_HYAVF|nr:ALDH-like protein [Hyaloscypha variabilis F]